MGRALDRLVGGTEEIVYGLVPQLAGQGMVGKALDLLVEPAAINLLDGTHEFDMEGAAAFLEYAAIDHFVGQRVLEAVLLIRRQARLEQELRGLQRGQGVVEFIL